MKLFFSRGLLLSLLAAIAVVAVPAPAHGDGPTPAKPAQAGAAAQKVAPASPGAAQYLQKPVTVARPTITDADRAAAQAAFDKALAAYKVDNDKKRLKTAFAGLSANAAHLYRARVERHLQVKKVSTSDNPGLSSVAPRVTYALTNGVVVGYEDIDCQIKWTIDFTLTNRGTATPERSPTGDFSPFFTHYYPSEFWPAPTSVATLPVLAARATATLRVEVNANFKSTSLENNAIKYCDRSKPWFQNANIGMGAFNGVGYLQYDFDLVNGSVVVTEVGPSI